MGNIEDQVETINDLKVLATEVDVLMQKQFAQRWMISNLNYKMRLSY